MNKIFKVVWSKSKECYVVVSEVAKNNGGKKKVLASVLAGLAIMGAGAQMGTPVLAGADNSGSAVNIWSNQRVDTPAGSTTGNTVTNAANTAGDNSVAIGQQLTTGTGAVAVGRLSTALADRAVAIGESVNSKKEDTISIGSSNNSNIGGAITIGKGNTADSTVGGGSANGNSQVAIGRDNKATDEDTLAIGRENNATERLAMALGNRTEATGVGSIAIGSNGAPYVDGSGNQVVTKTNSTGTFSIAIGAQTDSTGTASTAVGGKSKATANSATAVGREANASAENATALGYKSEASVKDGVALGSNSKATTNAGVNGYDPADSRTITYGGLTGNAKTSTLAAVSVGDGLNATRQITGLAAGKEDTDAVNVAQLKSVSLKYAGNTGSGDFLLKDGTLNLKGEGLISTTADGNGVTVKLKTGDTIDNNKGKAVAPAPNGVATTDNVVQAINNSGWNANASANGGTLTGSATATKVVPGDTVTFSAGKNLTVAQTLGTNTQQYTYALSSTLKDIESIQNGTSKITLNNGGGTTISGGNLSVDDNKITNVATGTANTDAVNVKQLKDTEKHIKPGTYAVENDGTVTLKYVDGNGTEQTETAKITGIAKKAKVINGQNTTVEEGTDTTDNSVTYKVNVKGNLADISSITNGAGSGKISFEGDQVVKVGGDHPISFDGKRGYVTGLENKSWDLKNPTIVSGRAATEDQLKAVSDGFNNTVKLTGNAGVTGTQKLNQDNGLSFGVVGADNGKYITTTASGSNVVADLSTDAKNKLNSKVVVTGSGAATVATPTVTTNADGSTVTTYTVHVDPVAATTASTESVVKKDATAGDVNIAEVSVADNKNTGDAGAKYEVSVSKNAVKDAARDAVTVNNGGNTDNPITVTPTKDENIHNTTYAVTFDGNKAAKQIPLTYKATNGTTTSADQTVKLDKGLNFTGGDYTTASVGADGKVTFDVTLGTAPVVTDGKPGVPGQAGAAGKDGIATVKTVVDTINNSGWKANAKANGGTLDGNSTATVVKPGNTVNYAAGKNLIVKQELETDASNALTGNQTYTYSLNKDIDLTNAGSLTVGDTKVNNDGITIKAPTPAAGTTATTDVKLTNTGLDNGGNKITNVAEGENNTDAVNVKQLKANRTEVKAGDNVVVTSDVDATDNHTVYTVNAVTPAVYTTPDGEKLTKDKDGKFHKVGETAEYTGDIITSFENPKAAAGQTTKDGGMIVNNIGSAIKNQTPTMPAGQTATYLDKLKAAADAGSNVKNAAVNVSDLKSTADALKANERHIAPTTVPNTSNENTAGTPNAAGTANVYKYDATNKTVTLTYNDGNGNAVADTKAVIDFSALNTGGTGASSWNIASDKVSATEGTVAAGSAAAQNIADGKTVTMQAGKNLTVNQTNDAAGNASVAFSLDKDLTNLDKVVVNGKDGIAGKDGVTIVGPQGATGAPGMPGTNGIDGKVGITGKDGKDAVSISGKDGIGTIGLTGPQGPAGQDGRGVDITTDHGTQTLYKPEASNNNQSERIVYVPKDKDGTPLKDTDGNPIKREVATMDDGLKFTGNNTSTENKQKLGSLVKVQGEGTKESTAVDPVTGKKYVVLSDGTTKFESAKDNIAVEADGTDTLTVKLNKDLKGLNSIQLGGNTIQSNGDNITFTTNGGTTKTVATTDQLWTIQANGIDVPATNGKVNVVGKDGITVAKNAAGNLEISGTGLGTMNGFDVTANNGDTTKTIKDGNKVDFNATSNLTVKQTSDANGTHIEYSLNKDVDLGNTGSLKTGDTTINNDGFKNGNTTVGGNGMTIKNPADLTKTVSLTKDGLNNGGNQIKNVAPGTDGTDAVNVDQLNQAVAAATSTESVVKKALTGDRNIADISVADGKNTGDKNAKYEVSVSENAVKDAAREAVEVTGSGVIKVTADSTTTPHKTTYDVAYDPDKAADVTKISYKSSTSTDAGSQAPKKTTLANGLDFTSDDHSVAITTGANGKVNFKVDTSGIQGKAFNLDVNKEGTGKVETAQTAATTNSVEKGTKFVAGNNLSIRHDAINGDANYDHQVTYALNSDLQGITSITNNGGATMNFGPNEVSMTGGNLNMGDHKITNVKNGTDKSDVATVGQLTKVTSNDNTVAINKTTDADGAPVYDLSVQGGGHDPRVDQLDEEIGRVGAQGAALAALKPIQYDPLEPTQIMAGYGNYRGNSAIAMGVAHYKNESTLMHAGVSWAGGSRHMMANAGVTWKVGNRDSEAAVADRYRKGPISSAYAMQQEMASVKAQNAGLKTEVSDLKAENEQMKAQIAAMMAKLGM